MNPKYVKRDYFHTIKSILNLQQYILLYAVLHNFHTIKSILNYVEPFRQAVINDEFPYY